MKILIIGDFHGKLSTRLDKKIRKICPELVLISGDLCGNKTLSKFFFEKIYGKNEEDIPAKDLAKYSRLNCISIRSGVKLIKKIKKWNIQIYSIRGNWDPTPFGFDLGANIDKDDLKKIRVFEKMQNKKFSFIDMDMKEFNNFILVGGASSTAPQRLNRRQINPFILKNKMKEKNAQEYISILKKSWYRRQKLYDKNFEKANLIRKRTGKKIIFLTHNCPYNTKLDKLKKGPMKGKHYGSYQERQVIQKYKPDIVFCGHMHENFGKDRIGKSLIWNVGSALEERFILAEI